MCVGIGQGRIFVALESSAKEFVSLKNGENDVLCSDGDLLDISRVEKA